MSSKAKKILKIVLIILLVLVLIVGGYFAYVMIAYHRIEDKQVLEVNDTIGNTAQADEEYKVISYNIGFAARRKRKSCKLRRVCEECYKRNR